MSQQKIDKFKLTEFDYNKHCYVEMVTTNACNLKCEYCHWNGVKIDPSSHISLEEFDKVLDFIEAQERETIEFNFYGGEPTLNPYLPEMVDRLNNRFGEKVKIITLLTNLSRPLEYLEKLMCKPMKIICSLHLTQCKTPEKWMEKAMALEANMEQIRVVLSDLNCKNAIEVYNTYKDYWKDRICLHIIDQLTMDDVYDLLGDELIGKNFYKDTDTESHASSEHVEIIADGEQIPIHECKNCHNFQGMMCSAGFVILRNGDVLKCWKDLNNRVLLNVFNDEIKKLPVWEMCRYTDCSCDERFTKLSIKEYLKENKVK